MIPKSRHPKINYWFWTDSTLEGQDYLKTLDKIAASSRFDMLTLTDRGCDFWDPVHKEHFRLLVNHAHELGIKIVLQLWPRGFAFPCADFLTADEGAAVTSDLETVVKDGRAILRSQATGVRTAYKPIDNEILCAYVFKKTGDGTYEKGSLHDVTDRVQTVYRAIDRLTVTLDLPEYEGYTVFAIAAYYYPVADAYSDRMINDYKGIMDYYADVSFDGIALDEFKTLSSFAPFTFPDRPYRERMYGRAFARVFREQTGHELSRTMLDMRYCPDGQGEVRAAAINRYFEVWRHGTTRVENFVCDYSKKIFGEDAFLGFHNTYHNDLDSDEIWNTSCNWWEVKRDYAQTDENMIFPVRMGLACRAREAIVYDMYYHQDKNTFFEKCMREAALGSRIHYHAIDDGSEWGLDTGSDEFLREVAKYEEHTELLNLFEPTLPAMSLLIVFGFPAQLNWYPDECARSQFDINKSLRILEKADALWRMGYHNALTCDDAIVRGELTQDEDGRLDYNGHKFDAMLFLYPEYAKPETVAFLQSAIRANVKLRVVGSLTHGFDGAALDGRFLTPYTIAPTESASPDIAQQLLVSSIPAARGMRAASTLEPEVILMLKQAADALGATQNDIANGCRLADKSVVISHYESVRDGLPYTAAFTLDGALTEATFIGSFAIKTDGNGNLEKLISGELLSLTRNGEQWLPDLRGKLVRYGV